MKSTIEIGKGNIVTVSKSAYDGTIIVHVETKKPARIYVEGDRIPLSIARAEISK